ncbi:thiamine-phosphate kinase [Fictibacillus barbaricus]|uniref:Thiamine-monophosphate kinase n=1 Tax=Fictibacillus barbaricus TaxID=182136 RepID=A0ABU1U6A1_9BACL|nr:thiamine-phosphate kinase [Fictibacillus barbaricus]MDR7074988.1 thiamine-monophosphate kinase [Fictibacillus barbaricus]
MLRDEFEWIKSIIPSHSHQKNLLMGIGDDAAIWSVDEDMDQVVCVDTMVEGVHFTRDTLSPAQIGHKALAVNLSDIAAMGAIPQFYLVSIAISPECTEEELHDLYEGMRKLADLYKTDLIGGDTVSTKGPLVLTVTVIGKVEKGKSLYRKNAEPDDVVFLTGITGESAAGLQLLLSKTRQYSFNEAETSLTSQHQMPQPHIKQGRLLAKSGFRTALNDVSDGIASELNEIAEASDVTIHIDEEKLPISSILKSLSKNERLTYQLYGGEDYVLVGTMAEKDFNQVVSEFDKSFLPLYKIGRVTERGETAVLINQEPLTKKGFNHFRER